MAFKMKGFPLRSGFKHTGGGTSHEDHHSGEEGGNTSNVEGNQNVPNQNVEMKKDPFMPSTPEFEASYADAKMKKAMEHYKRMMILYNKQLNNPKIPKNEVMNEPVMPTKKNIGDFRADGSYGI